MNNILIGVMVGGGIGIAILIGVTWLDHLLWMKFAREDQGRKTHTGYGFYLAIKNIMERIANKGRGRR